MAEMACVEIDGFGAADRLRLIRRPRPEPGPEEVLIRVRAAGVNRPDLLQRQGKYPPPPGASDLPGLEVAGEIAALGDAVQGWRVGDAVTALLAGGGYAEYAAAPAVQCLPIPARLSLVEAAALPETWFTVWTNIVDRGRLSAGEWILIHGGASGIGVAAIQLAKQLGAKVAVTAGTAAKGDACRALGADLAIDYRQEDFVAAIKEATDGVGVDVILDMVGGAYYPRNIDSLAPDGRLVVIACQQGVKAEINLWTVMARRLTVTGSTLRARPASEKGRIAAALRQTAWPWFDAGLVKPVIQAVFPLAEAAAAHAALESGDHVGKIMLCVD